MSQTTHTPAPPRRHPALETLAAFVDGRLGDDDHRHLVEHLAACELCREVVAETVHLADDPALAEIGDGGEEDDEDEPSAPGRVLRRRGGWPRRTLPLFGALAAAGLAALLFWTATGRGFLGLGVQPVAVGELTAALDRAAVVGNADGIPTGSAALGLATRRGAGDVETPLDLAPEPPQTPQQAFRLGIRFAMLGTALEAGEHDLAEDNLNGLGNQGDLSGLAFSGVRSMVTDSGRYSVRGCLQAADCQQKPTALLAQADALLTGTLDAGDHPLLDHPDWYELGKWIGAAWVAAHVGDTAWFGEESTVRRLRRLRRERWSDATDSALVAVTGIVLSGVAEEDLPALKEALRVLTAAAGGRL